MNPSRIAQGLALKHLRYGPGVLGKAALARALNSQLRREPLSRIVRARFGARFDVDTRDLIQRYLCMFGVWEPHLSHWLRHRLRPGDVFVDVGANIGYFSLLGSSLVGANGTVVAVEPSPELSRQLKRHARLNDAHNLRVIQGAVSDREETLNLVLASSSNTGATSAVPFSGSAERRFDVRARPLPDVLTEREVRGARVFKLDVEGGEGAVVRGMRPLFEQLHPDVEIVVEVTPERVAALGDSSAELLQTFTDHGFHAYRLLNDYAPETYPSAIRRPQPPRRWQGPVTREMDLVFSRIEAEALP